jgi:hypothetical protein
LELRRRVTLTSLASLAALAGSVFRSPRLTSPHPPTHQNPLANFDLSPPPLSGRAAEFGALINSQVWHVVVVTLSERMLGDINGAEPAIPSPSSSSLRVPPEPFHHHPRPGTVLGALPNQPARACWGAVLAFASPGAFEGNGIEEGEWGALGEEARPFYFIIRSGTPLARPSSPQRFPQPRRWGAWVCALRAADRRPGVLGERARNGTCGRAILLPSSAAAFPPPWRPAVAARRARARAHARGRPRPRPRRLPHTPTYYE